MAQRTRTVLQSLLAFGAVLALTLLACALVAREQQRQIDAAFASDTRRLLTQVDTRLQSHFAALRSMRGLFAAQSEVSRLQFQQFLEQLRLRDSTPGFQAVQYVRALPEAQRADFVAAVRGDRSLHAEGYPRFDIHPANTLAQHYVIEYNEPMRGNEAAFGLDLAALPAHLRALELGRDSGLPVATEPLKLVQDQAGRTGFVVRMPIYRRGAALQELAQRRAALQGFAALVYRVDDLMRDAIDAQLLPALRVRIGDIGYAEAGAAAAATAQPLFDSAPGALATGLRMSDTLVVGQRRWAFEISALPGGRYEPERARLLAILLPGLLMALLCAGLVAAWASRRALALQLASTLAEQKAIFDNAAVGIQFVKNRRIQACNSGLAEMLGYRAEELVGASTRILFASDQAFEAAGKAAYAGIAAEQHWIGDVEWVRKDGSPIQCRLHGRHIDPQRLELGSVWVCYDISALQAAQAQLIQHEKLASLGQLVANVAHEINTPIAAIKSSSLNLGDALALCLSELPHLLQLLEPPLRARFIELTRRASLPASPLSTREERLRTRELGEALEQAGVADARRVAGVLVQLGETGLRPELLALLQHPQQAQVLRLAEAVATLLRSAANINAAVERVAKIVLALKRFSRSDPQGQPTATDLRESLETVLTLYHNQFRQGVELVRDYQDDLPPLPCLPDELHQVWTNLIHNALQAMNYRGVLHIGLRRRGDAALVTVADTGCGIPAALRAQIFEPFFTTKPAGEGSGLGLDIVKRIVTRHGGRIDVYSEPGQGARFEVLLPYAGA
ncbi:CHASE domain-containing protein [Paucibacter soli]|uniref:CHASE domain-containing protein n=1 Tax=Paucibacter soli TaxID=3133433 RepID=UPI003094F1EA